MKKWTVNSAVVFGHPLLVFCAHRVQMLERVGASVSVRHCVPVSSVASRRHLRSAAWSFEQQELYSDPELFGVSIPVVWNSLPAELRASSLTVVTWAKGIVC